MSLLALLSCCLMTLTSEVLFKRTFAFSNERGLSAVTSLPLEASQLYNTFLKTLKEKKIPLGNLTESLIYTSDSKKTINLSASLFCPKLYLV